MDTVPHMQNALDEINIAINDKPEDNPQPLVEEKYTSHNEGLLKHWLKIARENSTAHNKKGKKLKWRHELFGLPTILLPLMFTPISGILADEEGMQYANVAVIATTGILSGVHNFFDYARKSQKHFEYEAKYADLATTIMVELSKERSLRIRADRFIEMVQSKIDNMGASAPLL